MKGFKECGNGHFYKDTLSKCNYCPNTEGSSSNINETELINDDGMAKTQDTVRTEKTQVFGGVEAPQQSSYKSPQFDPEKTMISGSGGTNMEGSSKEQNMQKRKLRGWLVSFDIEDFGVDFKVIEGKNSIGKNTSNDITIQDNQVSGLQGIILCKKDQFFLTDEVSSNGTLLNGKDLDPRRAYELNDGDEIKVGNTTLLFKTAFKK